MTDYDDVLMDQIHDMMAKEQETTEKKISKEDLSLYYEHSFPFEIFFKWLGLGKSDFFERREICFTLENDAYIRFQCYQNPEEYKRETLRGVPFKIDIGAVYNTLPKYHKSVYANDGKNFAPEQKDLVFDIDMTDYDDVRTCCKEANICQKCWAYMVVAYKILNRILRDDFGFEHLMWVFSGRRGIHCWVSDRRARVLGNDGRSAIANYIKLRTKNQNTGFVPTLREPIHPSIEYKLIK
jgi:DNA primase small subunit